MSRKFEITDARRVQVPLLIGIAGPSWSGKTYSALRLATGIAKVNQGPIVFIDTEGRRALHYADDFKFRHIPFTEPYGSLDYVAAIDIALQSKPAVIVVDSATHEHEGTGGYLDLANSELEAGKKEGQHWAKPSVCRRRLLSRIQTLPCSAIFCSRAKESLDWKEVFAKRAKAPPPMGETIVGTSDFSFEMTIRFLVHAGSNGVPTWDTSLKGEKAAIKLPKQFVPIFGGQPRQISEADGEAMAKWAAGEAPAGAEPKRTITDDELDQYAARMLETPDVQTLQKCRASIREALKGVALSDDQRDYMADKFNARKRELEAEAA